MKKLFDIKRLKFYLWVGLAFWSVLMLSYISRFPGTLQERGVNELWRVGWIVVLNYLLFEYTLPNMSTKKIIRSIIMLGIHVFLYSCGLYVWRAIGIHMNIYTVFKIYPSQDDAITAQVSFSISSIFFFGIIKHIYDHIKLRQATQKLRIEKQEAELNYLKSQTNPHFLFNTLNNIYSLARDKSDLAPESILRLSKILRFMLYETSGAFIAIEQELKIISDYIALEKLRYDDSLLITFSNDIEDMKQAIPPLLLIPLVENAFKHGVSETRFKPFVDIHLSVNKRQLKFSVKNSSEGFVEGSVKENIGLANLRRQLELLYTDYNLVIQQGESVFTATLQINLASHV